MAAVRRLLSILLVLLAALPAAALASPSDVIRDCSDDGKLSKKYSLADLQKASRGLPADVADYTDCKSVITRALRNVATGSSANSGSNDVGVGDESNLSEQERKVLDEAVNQKRERKKVKIGPGVVEPGSLDSSSSIPTPLVAVLVLTAIGGLAGIGELARRFVSRRNSP